MRKQPDHRRKQLDKFESSVKNYAETKTSWRRKFSAKEGELETLKVCRIDILRLFFPPNASAVNQCGVG